MIEAIFLLTFLSACGVCDIETGKIPNVLTFSGMFTGLFFCGSLQEAGFRLIGMAVILTVGMFGLLGMGDIKMWMAMAAMAGTVFSCSAMLAGIGCLLLKLAICREGEALRSCFAPAAALLIGRRTGNLATHHKEPFAQYAFFGSAICVACILFWRF